MSQKSGSLFDMQFITSCISTMLVLLLLGMVVFFVMTANNLSVYVRENINFSVLLNDDMKEAEAIRFQKQLRRRAFCEAGHLHIESTGSERTDRSHGNRSG